MPFQPATYIVTNKARGLPYIGVTSNLIQRIHQHREGIVPGFTQKYRLKRLVHFEQFGTMELAIAREKQLKNWHRPWKINLIEATNPDWRDLAEDLGFEPLR
ncbi:GIY-YIG nuclease family protein [Sphingorhabdus sp. EL138]|uniref:GIY-YIG nuclease family protein n=1 Tax=Sphingorhabdus sp. EL138 TaxID=2073156 RepID=UPI000D69A7B0|nr:GIY-YIG nuclease family protein [Sphingorhabdus sp. EL138]